METGRSQEFQGTSGQTQHLTDEGIKGPEKVVFGVEKVRRIARMGREFGAYLPPFLWGTLSGVGCVCIRYVFSASRRIATHPSAEN